MKTKKEIIDWWNELPYLNQVSYKEMTFSQSYDMSSLTSVLIEIIYHNVNK